MSAKVTRRTFVAGSMALSALGAGGPAASALGQPTPGPATAVPAGSKGTLPKGKIGDLEVSRMLLGGNLLTHYTHSRDLRYVYNLTKHYNTEEKIFETMAEAEAHGINTLVIHTAAGVMNMLKKYRNERGGKMQWIICPTAPVEEGLVKYGEQVQQMGDEGVDAIYLWGVTADRLIKQGRVDLVAKAVDLARAQDVPSGVGAHDLEVVRACQQNKVRCDFYIKTLHHHKYRTGPKPEQITTPHTEFPGYWCSHPAETIELMKSVEKPWIAFKVMAAGAIPPKDAFRFVLEGGADFVLAGMFDFEIAEDVGIFRDLLAAKLKRDRPWRA